MRDACDNLTARNLWTRPAASAAVALACFVVTWVHQAAFRRADMRYSYVNLVFQGPELTKGVATFPPEAVRPRLGRSVGLRGVRAAPVAHTPIVRWGRVHAVSLPKENTSLDTDVTGYVAPAIEYDTEKASIRVRDGWFRPIMNVLSALATGLAVYLLLGLGDSFRRCAAGLALLRLASLLWCFALFGYFSIHALDESQYLNVARRILDWSHHEGTFPYTLGNPILYLPLLVWTHHLSEFAFTAIGGTLYFLVFGVGSVLCLAWIVWRHAGSRAAKAAAVCVVVYPWLMKVYHKPDDMFTYFGLWLKHPVNMMAIEFYYFTDFVGCNMMSDTPAMCFGLLGLAALDRQLRRGDSWLVPGLLLGFSALIRLTNVFLLLPAALLCLTSEDRLHWKRPSQLAGGFAAMLALQAVWNWAVFGHPLTLGYALEPDVIEGFRLASFPDGVRVAGRVHQQLLALGALALLSARHIPLRLRALLAALVPPLLLYYCGYPWIKGIPVRYLLTPLTVLMAAGGGLLSWPSGIPRSRRVFSVTAVVLALLLIPQTRDAAYHVHVPQTAVSFLFGALAVAALLWGRNGWHALFFAVMAVGNPWITLTFALGACTGLVVRLLVERREAVRTRLSELLPITGGTPNPMPG